MRKISGKIAKTLLLIIKTTQKAAVAKRCSWSAARLPAFHPLKSKKAKRQIGPKDNRLIVSRLSLRLLAQRTFPRKQHTWDSSLIKSLMLKAPYG
ncbi:hypothetical protein SAMN05192529_10175 [Arachidicoccus rhizosphaerae]|uniref:Uncharacterized protein n=1 Tax=Arachidicoccus rhizosphaerae TaxID=551991 RepID=A0A1H3VG21_9BACT|nr:hypothetical protein [Arachidicoccus rhizosphaerae]SDZ73706.1 hypothetical protein SAMN05192529_10175 [Arachidicoccus rhizosphaerae]